MLGMLSEQAVIGQQLGCQGLQSRHLGDARRGQYSEFIVETGTVHQHSWHECNERDITKTFRPCGVTTSTSEMATAPLSLAMWARPVASLPYSTNVTACRHGNRSPAPRLKRTQRPVRGCRAAALTGTATQPGPSTHRTQMRGCRGRCSRGARAGASGGRTPRLGWRRWSSRRAAPSSPPPPNPCQKFRAGSAC